MFSLGQNEFKSSSSRLHLNMLAAPPFEGDNNSSLINYRHTTPVLGDTATLLKEKKNLSSCRETQEALVLIVGQKEQKPQISQPSLLRCRFIYLWQK
jgi:hypothetical protein